MTAETAGAAPTPSHADRPLADEVGFLAIKAASTGTRLARARLRPLGLHVRTYSALAVAAGSATGASQREIAEYLDLDPSQLVALIDELESSGLVAREVDPNDRRYRLIRATAQGADALAQARTETSAAEDEALGMLTADERATLLALLRKVVFAAPAGA